VQAADRPRYRAGRQVLPHLPPLGDQGAGRDLLSAVRRVSTAETAVRSGRAVSERVVPPLPRDVRGRAWRDGYAGLIRNVQRLKSTKATGVMRSSKIAWPRRGSIPVPSTSAARMPTFRPPTRAPVRR